MIVCVDTEQWDHDLRLCDSCSGRLLAENLWNCWFEFVNLLLPLVLLSMSYSSVNYGRHYLPMD